MFTLKRLSIALVFGASMAISGCASNKVSMSQEEFSAAMAQSSMSVDTLLEKGNQEEAVKILGDLAKKNPGRKEPWVRMAKVHFDAENYAQAIVAAEEALQRDGTDRSAKSIRAVAGLRVAAQSLTDLRGDVELKGDARSDAVGLAKVMRDTLGEDVLVPPGEDKKKKVVPVARPKPATVAAAPKKSNGAADAAPAASGANPFSVLK
jgi:hypothetical protein